MKKTIQLLATTTLLTVVASCTNGIPYEDVANENYTKAFIKEFGLIDPNHTWGFGPQVKSRAVSTNGNQWKTPPVVTVQERNDIFAYLQEHKEDLIDRRADLYGMTSYFVTEVGASFEEYTAVNGTTTIEGSDKMNHLMIAEWNGWTMGELNEAENTSGGTGGSLDNVGHWAHCSNFNFASNDNFGGNTIMFTGDDEDEIGAYHFACHNSFDSHYHDRYKVIWGGDVNKKYEYAYYVCFDYDSHTDNFSSNFELKYNELQRNTQQVTGYADFDGVYTDDETTWPSESELITKLGLVDDYSQGLIDVKSVSINSVDNGVTRFAVSYDKVTIQRNERPVNLNFTGVYYDKDDSTTWPSEAELIAKAGLTAELEAGNIEFKSMRFLDYSDGDKYIPGNNVYDDWVIRIVGPAIRADSNVVPDYPWEYSDPIPVADYNRIMVEDLSIRANSNLDVKKSDWDFNDVVIDAYYDAETSTMHLKLQALGGTLPVYIFDKNLAHHTNELHTYFGVSTRTMVNTGAGARKDPVKLNNVVTGIADFDFDGDYRNIRIFVDVDGSSTEMKDLEDMGGLVELAAKDGNAPSKFMVPSSVAWSTEYTHICDTYPSFRDWVGNENKPFWETEQNNGPSGD